MGRYGQIEMTKVDYAEPHFSRTQKLLKDHPELGQLLGNIPHTAWFIFLIVGLQIAIASQMHQLPLWGVFVVSYLVGAFADHALWTLIHENTHNLIFRKSSYSMLLQILCNLPIIFPSAISFRYYHLKHHLHQGELDRDADLPRHFEVNWVQNSSVKKVIWQLFYFVPQALRVLYMKGIKFFDRWVFLNWVVQISFLVAMTKLTGWNSLIYIALSSIFAIGLHPVGARWVQEHYVVHENQETYSYYGPLNWLAFNVGYHNEHHDLMGVPWARLPKVRAMAPEYYNSLYYHTSWTGLLIRFIRDKKIGLYSRITRSPGARGQAVTSSFS